MDTQEILVVDNYRHLIMDLSDSLKVIVSHLEKGSFPNEQAITQGIVLRILSCLGWDQYNPDLVWPEYSVSSRRVDLALCHPPRKPTVFIEVKQPGKTEDADRQLFEYAFHEGVPIAVLTDGQTWSFYLPAEQGSYEDRRVYKLDLMERTIGESVEKLNRYLQNGRIITGEALDDARRDYKSRNRSNQAKLAIPAAWKDLIDAEDTSLIDLLFESVEKKCGFKPDRSDVINFFNAKRFAPLESGEPFSSKNKSKVPAMEVAPTADKGRGSYFIYHNQTYQSKSAKDVVIGILKKFASEKPNFYELCYNHQDNEGRSRLYIGRTPKELYKNRQDLEAYNVQLDPGWFLMTNFNNQVKANIIRMACEVMGYQVNREISYQL